jgi:hypothetical protein
MPTDQDAGATDEAAANGTSSAVPADLRAYSQAAVLIDEHIHQLALRLGRVLDAYRASRPEFGRPLPRIEDDLERYARRCLEIDRGVGQVAAAFEHAGAVPQGGASAANTSQPVVAAEATIAATLEEGRRAAAVRAAAAAAPSPPPTREHHNHGLLGGLIHAVEHPGDTAAALATGAEHVATGALHGLESLDGGILHAIEHPMDTLSSAEQAADDFVTGFATGVKDMAQAAMLLARVIPGTPMWRRAWLSTPRGR